MLRRTFWCLVLTTSSSCSALDSRSSNRTGDDELCKVITKTDDDYVCKPIDQCPVALRDAENRVSYPKICRFQGRTPVVCCPTTQEYSGQKAIEKCREYYSLTTSGGGMINFVGSCRAKSVKKLETNRLTVIGGTTAEESEFPHMVILGFGEHMKNVEWSCGGSLISDRYVLSAAHCSEIGKRGQLKWALMGDNDMGSDVEDADPQIREIVERILHPNYEPPSVYNDIALFRLNAPVQFGRFILPVCLNAETQLATGQNLIAVGWGRTGPANPTSNILMKVSFDLIEQNECNSSYFLPNSMRLASGINPNSQICAGKTEGGKDTCQGDSGGPLQIVHPDFQCMYSQIGITSFGKICGEPNAPGVYTRVSNYLPWIESIVWPSS